MQDCLVNRGWKVLDETLVGLVARRDSRERTCAGKQEDVDRRKALYIENEWEDSGWGEHPHVLLPELKAVRYPADQQVKVSIISNDSKSNCRISIINSTFPSNVQCDIAMNGKANRAQIQRRVDGLLLLHGLHNAPPERLPARGHLLVKAPLEMEGIPFWAYRASGIMPQHLMDDIIKALNATQAAGCKPFINPLKKAESVARRRAALGLPPRPGGGLRSDYEAPFHVGVFKHPNQTFDSPWITKDTLQGFSGTSPARTAKVNAMLVLCKALDTMAMGPIANALGRVAPDLLQRNREFAKLRRHSAQVVQHDIADRLPSNAPSATADPWPYLRFGNLGTAVAIGKGQSEKLHLDVHDDERLPTVLMVMGEHGKDWDRSNGQGDIVLPTLGISIPLFPGDVFIFYASLLPHRVNALPREEQHKRTVATLFTCAPTRHHLEQAYKTAVSPGMSSM